MSCNLIMLLLTAVVYHAVIILFKDDIMEYIGVNMPTWMNCPFCVGYNLGIIGGALYVWAITHYILSLIA